MCGSERESDPGSTFPGHTHDLIFGTGEDLESYLLFVGGWEMNSNIPTVEPKALQHDPCFSYCVNYSNLNLQSLNCFCQFSISVLV